MMPRWSLELGAPDFDRVYARLEAQKAREKKTRDFLTALPGFDFTGAVFPRPCVLQELLQMPSDINTTSWASPPQPQFDPTDQISKIFHLASSLRENSDDDGEVFWHAFADVAVEEAGVDMETIDLTDIRSFIQFFVDGAKRHCDSPSNTHYVGDKLYAFEAVARWMKLSNNTIISWSFRFDNQAGQKKRKRMGNETNDGDQRNEVPALEEELNLLKKKLDSSQSDYKKLAQAHMDLKLKYNNTKQVSTPMDTVNNDKTKSITKKGSAKSTKPTKLEPQLTGWEAAQAKYSAVGEQGRPGHGEVVQILDLPAVPGQLKLRDPRSTSHLTEMDCGTERDIVVAVSQAVGEVMSKDGACDYCQRGLGLWRDCVKTSDLIGEIFDPMGGSCANCYIRREPCSLRP